MFLKFNLVKMIQFWGAIPQMHRVENRTKADTAVIQNCTVHCTVHCTQKSNRTRCSDSQLSIFIREDLRTNSEIFTREQL